jgi:HSP20 family protein
MLPRIFGENLMDDWFNDDFWFPTTTRRPASYMKTDVREKDGNYELTVELPGFKKEDLNISLENGYLKIQASNEQSKEEKDNEGRLIRQERYSGSMARSFYVGEQVSEKDIHAKFEDGVLKLTVPNQEQQKAIAEKKTIDIE